MVDCGTKLIFLTTPGVREHLKQMYKNKIEYAVIERALKVRNRVVFLLETFFTPKKSYFNTINKINYPQGDQNKLY